VWRLRIGDSTAAVSNPVQVSLTTGTGFSPRLGRDYLLYVSSNAASDSIWKLAEGTETELWSAQGSKIIGGPAISPDGRSIVFSARQQGRAILYVMQADGANARIVCDSLDLQGTPAWEPDGKSIASAAEVHASPHLFRIPLDGSKPTDLVADYALDPVWSPDGQFVVYSGADVGTTFPVKTFANAALAHPVPALTLTRGARRLAFLNGGRTLAMLRGELQHKDVWLVDLETGAQKQITSLPADFDVRDFDISPDGSEVVLERIQERSDVILVDLPQQ
jgi:Tol biopolymer transport system component